MNFSYEKSRLNGFTIQWRLFIGKFLLVVAVCHTLKTATSVYTGEEQRKNKVVRRWGRTVFANNRFIKEEKFDCSKDQPRRFRTFSRQIPLGENEILLSRTSKHFAQASTELILWNWFKWIWTRKLTRHYQHCLFSTDFFLHQPHLEFTDDQCFQAFVVVFSIICYWSSLFNCFSNFRWKFAGLQKLF